jgi:hypothetical protein
MLKKFFCSHNWESFRRKKYSWKGKTIVTNTEHWHNPIVEESDIEESVEVLACKKCGALKTIKY